MGEDLFGDPTGVQHKDWLRSHSESGKVELVVDGTRRILIDNALRICTKCKVARNLSEFGVRVMEDGTARWQPRCNHCPR